MTLVTEDTSRN